MAKFKHVWDSIHDDYHFEERKDMRQLVNHIISDKVESVAEFAVGSGMFPVMLRKAGWQGSYQGYDYHEGFLKNAKKNNPNEDFQYCDLDEPFPIADKQFDLSVVIHGMDYVQDTEVTLKELKRITKKFIYLDYWRPFEQKDFLRFEIDGNVNIFGKDKFYQTLKDLNLEVVQDYVQLDEKGLHNHIIKLQL